MTADSLKIDGQELYLEMNTALGALCAGMLLCIFAALPATAPALVAGFCVLIGAATVWSVCFSSVQHCDVNSRAYKVAEGIVVTFIVTAAAIFVARYGGFPWKVAACLIALFFLIWTFYVLLRCANVLFRSLAFCGASVLCMVATLLLASQFAQSPRLPAAQVSGAHAALSQTGPIGPYHWFYQYENRWYLATDYRVGDWHVRRVLPPDYEVPRNRGVRPEAAP